MEITIDKTAASVTLTLSAAELAVIDVAVDAFKANAMFPRSAHDRAAQGDIEIANAMEQRLFNAYRDLTGN